MSKLLVISQDTTLAKKISNALTSSGFDLTYADDLETASESADIVIYAPETANQTNYQHFQKHPLLSSAEWILMSDGVPNQWLDKMMSHGVAYHFRMPLNFNYLAEVVQEYVAELKQENNRQTHAGQSSSLDQYGLLLGSSERMRRIYKVIRRVSRTDANVLLIGESGCGKELAARTIHQQSDRADERMICVNCAALTPDLIESELFGHEKGAFTGAISQHIGFFEQGGKGTLFLDEITEMPLALQSKLLRVLESGEFRRVGSDVAKQSQVRIIAATNRDPKQAIHDGFLREDLYFRLAHFPIVLPALRNRADDIVELAKHFLAYRNEATQHHKTFSEQALQAIANHDWPGNVRELKHCVERAHILAERIITIAELPALVEREGDLPQIVEPGTSLRDAEKSLILSTLEACDHNKTQAAKLLGITVKTLYNKLQQYNQSAQDIQVGI